MKLNGRWLAARGDDELRRRLPDEDLDDRAWTDVPVPGQWQSTEPFAQSDGPLLYRHRFQADAPAAGDRAWLTFEGIFYQADVWLDGSYLGDTEGYFAPHSFEISEQLAARGDHLLAVEVSCPPPEDLERKRNLTGVFQHWDCIDTAFNPGGIWATVRLTRTGTARLASLRVLCLDASAERATLALTAVIDTPEAHEAQVRTTVARLDRDGPDPDVSLLADHKLAAGANRVSWRVTVDRPTLWWPRALGEQFLYDVTVEVSTAEGMSDRKKVTTGLRQIRMRQFVAHINGERLFLKGSNVGPTRRSLAEVTPADVATDLALARDAGLDLLRVHAHVGHPELYRQADRAGMLLWQDLPMQWGYDRVRRQAVRQAREAVDLLGHHPSIVVWCGPDEPGERGGAQPPASRSRSLLRAALAQAKPALRDPGLAASVKRAFERADGSRPVVGRAGALPHPAGASDTHLSLGWDHGDERDLPGVLARWPAIARFVGSFGTPSVPLDAPFLDARRWPEVDWEGLADLVGLRSGELSRRFPPDRYATPDEWARATQAYQAVVARFHVESLRRLKYRPTGGFCYALLADCQPAVSRSLLDDQRCPKTAFAAFAAACQPVIVVADRPAATYLAGSTVSWAVHAVSDLRQPLGAVIATASLTWPGGSETWRWGGEVPADRCVLIGRIAHTFPEDAPPGPVHLEVGLSWQQDGRPGQATAGYDTRIEPRPTPTGRRRRRGD